MDNATHDCASACSSELLNPQSEPSWTQRGKPTVERLTATVSVPFLNTSIVLQQRGAHDTLGGTVWDSGIVLSKYLEHRAGLSRPLVHSDHTVLELGSGTGLVSIACALLGARTVVASDLNDPSLLSLLRSNIQSNIMTASSGSGSSSSSSSSPSPTCNVIVCAIDWSCPPPWSALAPADSAACWPEYPDVVVCSDLVYSDSAAEPLARCLGLYCGPDTVVLFAYEAHKFEATKLFFSLVRQSFDIEPVQPCDLCPGYSCGGVYVRILKRKPKNT